MTNQEILKKAIEKAIKNGWDFTQIEPEAKGYSSWRIIDEHDIGISHPLGEMFFSYVEIIFSHDFAKAFWGSEPYQCIQYGTINSREKCEHYPAEDHVAKGLWLAYEYHLMRMVLEVDRIQYLGRFL